MYFFGIHRKGEIRERAVFVEAVAASGMGIACGLALFPREASLIGVFLCAFAQFKTVEALLDRNADQIYDDMMNPYRANWVLAQSLTVLFFGIFLTYIAVVMMAPMDQLDLWFERQLGSFGGSSITDIDWGTPWTLMRRNGLVLVVCFLFALLYQHGGMLLVLAWNASKWGVIFAYLARVGSADAGMSVPGYVARTMAAIVPHLIFEAVAYVLIAMAGVFLSKALQKYPIGSPRFQAVSHAATRIVAFAALALVAAALLEALVAPRLVDLLF